jgi:DNA-binding response OmpR family regulator
LRLFSMMRIRGGGDVETTTQRRVLVVEDERTIAESVAARLRAEGFVVEIAGDGPGAVEAARRTPPDAVVLDVMLPGFDGLEVCRRLQAERPRRRNRPAGGPGRGSG